MLQVADTILFIAILLYSVVLHEVSHGHVANFFGDPTARMQGRLSLNPLKHLDPMGSIVVPLILILVKAPIFGWARPVPVNTYNLRNGWVGELAVSAAGVLSNFALALVAGLAIRFSGLSTAELLSSSFFRPVIIIAGINTVLGVFNLIPVPPLDGSKVLFSLLPYHMAHIQRFLEQFGFILLMLVIFIDGIWIYGIFPIINFLFSVFTGYGLGLYGDVLPF